MKLAAVCLMPFPGQARRYSVGLAALLVLAGCATTPQSSRQVHQINGAYEYGFFDASAVLCRRLMESLIVEIYISQKRQDQVSRDRIFFGLDGLIATITADAAIPLGRGSPKTMNEVKVLGDTAAHDRTYITAQIDIDDVKARYRKLVSELMTLAGIESKSAPA